MKLLRGLFLAIYAGYLAAALLVPKSMYVDRFLLNLPFSQWMFVQVLPSMYTSEILITRKADGRQTSVPHHPARMFWIMDRRPRCEAYNIRVRYRENEGNRDYLVCNGKLTFDASEPTYGR